MVSGHISWSKFEIKYIRYQPERPDLRYNQNYLSGGVIDCLTSVALTPVTPS